MREYYAGETGLTCFEELPVFSPPRITRENKEKFRLQPDRESAFGRTNGGAHRIRTVRAVSIALFDRVLC